MTVANYSATLALLTFATPVWADLSNIEALNALVTQAEELGYEVTVGNKNRAGSTLTANNVRYIITLPEVSVTMHIDEMIFQELGDGTVRLTSSDIPVAMAMDAEGEQVEIVGRVSLTGGESILGGSPDEMAMSFSYPSMIADLESVVVNGEEFDVTANFRMEQTVGTYDLLKGVSGGLSSFSSAYTIKAVSMMLNAEDPENQGQRIDITAAVSDLDVSGEGTVSEMASGTMPEGFWSNSTIKRGQITANIAATGPDGEMLIDFGDRGGSLSASVQNGLMEYSTQSEALKIGLGGSMIPIPNVEITVASSSTDAKMPMKPTADAQEFGFDTVINDLQVSDFLWSMIDPFNKLPHDPADIRLAASGVGKLTVDVFDPNFDPEAMTAAPGVLESLIIDEIALSAVGAKVRATGALDNAEANPLAIPRMAGAINIEAFGVQALMQNLGEMGILPSAQAGMANMFLGMFAVPGSQPDSYTSRIELTEDGGVLANGQRVK